MRLAPLTPEQYDALVRERAAKRIGKLATTGSDLEQTLLTQIRCDGLPEPTLQFQFAPPRRWRADLCWGEPFMLIVEVEGGIWSGGRHTTGAGFLADSEKHNTAVLLGYRVLRVCVAQIDSGQALRWIEQAIGATEETK